MKFTTVLYLLVLGALATAGCNEGSSGTANDQNAEPDPVTFVPVDRFVEHLSKQALNRDPDQAAPSQVEATLLAQQDQQLLSQVFTSSRFQFTMSRVLAAADISSLTNVFVHDDFRFAGIPFGGGMAGHDFFMIDGKFLDILGDYANYLALRGAGLTLDTPALAIDSIVNSHNASPFAQALERYPYQLLPQALKFESDRILDSYAGAITYHEFGHYYLYHMLDRLRSMGTFAELYINFTSVNEDDADRLAGALMRKAGMDLQLGQEMVDLMAFYVMNRNGQAFSIFDVVASLPAQFVPGSVNYSSLAVRKELFAEGYLRYSDYLQSGM